MKDDLLISISTENGTGSQTANKILTRSIILSGFRCNSKNLFPSNIAGLPTNYKIRVNANSFNSFSKFKKPDVAILFNKKTLEKDLLSIGKETLVLINKDLKYSDDDNKNLYSLPCRTLVKKLCPSMRIRKLLYNMLYVGAILKALGIDLKYGKATTQSVLSYLKEDLIEANLKALKMGFESCFDEPIFSLKPPTEKPETSIMDGNSAMALGFLDGGAQVLTWYPITPSSSVVENFKTFSKNLGQERAVLQCEDELSAVTTSLGAGWAGAKSLTTTSGPGLSLMQESIGLGYFTETPFVVANIQRAGPSTGLPTRTSQGDLLIAYYSSHGDTVHPVLLPSNPQEAYSDAFKSLSLAQDLQSPVFVLSDLDLGMNEWSTPKLIQEGKELSQGSIQKNSDKDYKRFSNDSLVPSRSLPGLSDSSTAYFTRGSGHDEYGRYTEDPDVFESKLLRIKEKIIKGRSVSSFFPEDKISKKKSTLSLIHFGTTSQIVDELLSLLKDHKFSTYQIRSLPLHENVNIFIDNHEINFILEQNRDGQMAKIIKSEIESKSLIKSCTHFNGLPADPNHFFNQIIKVLKNEY